MAKIRPSKRDEMLIWRKLLKELAVPAQTWTKDLLLRLGPGQKASGQCQRNR